MNNAIIVFDPHPDDADWWTGGLSLLLIAKGWKVHYVCIGPSSAKTRTQARNSARVLGVARRFLDIPIRGNQAFPTVIRKKIPKLLASLRPRIIFIPSLTDYHQEHVTVARELFRLFHWSAGLGLGSLEVYAYDSNANRDPVEIYIDISTVWDRHLQSLRCHRVFERPGLPDNTLIRIKTGRAMLLGTTVPSAPVRHAEGYRLLQGHVKKISSLSFVLRKEFFYSSPHGLLQM